MNSHIMYPFLHQRKQHHDFRRTLLPRIEMGNVSLHSLPIDPRPPSFGGKSNLTSESSTSRPKMYENDSRMHFRVSLVSSFGSLRSFALSFFSSSWDDADLEVAICLFARWDELDKCRVGFQYFFSGGGSQQGTRNYEQPTESRCKRQLPASASFLQGAFATDAAALN